MWRAPHLRARSSFFSLTASSISAPAMPPAAACTGACAGCAGRVAHCAACPRLAAACIGAAAACPWPRRICLRHRGCGCRLHAVQHRKAVLAGRHLGQRLDGRLGCGRVQGPDRRLHLCLAVHLREGAQHTTLTQLTRAHRSIPYTNTRGRCAAKVLFHTQEEEHCIHLLACSLLFIYTTRSISYLGDKTASGETQQTACQETCESVPPAGPA